MNNFIFLRVPAVKKALEAGEGLCKMAARFFIVEAQWKKVHKAREETVKAPVFDGKCGEIYHVLTGRETE